jgi:hypothetical protein
MPTALQTAQTTLDAFPQAATPARPMRAVVHRRYGEPGVLAIEEVGRPAARPGEVLVRVHAAGATIGDHHLVTGKPYLVRLSPFGGLPHRATLSRAAPSRAGWRRSGLA